MKIRRLSEIDLAKFAALQAGAELERALRSYNLGGGAWSYDPARNSICDVLGARTPLIPDLAPLPFDKIEAQIVRACKRGEDQQRANLEVGKALFDSARLLKWTAASISMQRLPIGFRESVRYWSDVVIQDSDGLFIPFFDHRREHGISSISAMQIVFSMQNIWVRERNPDLASARLALVKFPCRENGRDVRVIFHRETDLLSYEELNERVQIVYETWAQVSDERARVSRQTGTGGPNPFGF